MEILQPYDENSLKLTVADEVYGFTSFGEIYVDSYFDLIDSWNNGVISNSSYWQGKGVTTKESFGNLHYEIAGQNASRGFPKIKLSVFTDSGVFREDEDLSGELNDYYINGQEIFLKPNEYLDRRGFAEGNYNLQFDFLIRFRENDELFIAEISPSRKEIRLDLNTNVTSTDINQDYINQMVGFLNGGVVDDTYQFNSFLELSQGRLIPINGYALDTVTSNKNSFILKLNEPLPNDISGLSSDFFISNKFLSSQIETIFFIDREGLAVSGLGLEIDESFIPETNYTADNFKNYNDITSSVGTNIVEELTKLKKDVNLNIDYTKFDNHVFFGSAKSKLQNFKSKAVELEGLFTELSSSLNFNNTVNVIEKRKDLFSKIKNIQRNFTHYENFVYTDGQSYSTSSAPGIGANLAGNDITNKVDNSLNTLQDYQGFDKVFEKESDSYIHLFTDVYNAEDPPFFNSNDFFYLSFLLRASGSETTDSTTQFTLNISGGLANESYDLNSDETITEIGNYPYGNDRKLPFNAWSGSALLNPITTGSKYQRYIFKGQQNYFRPTVIPMISSENFSENSTTFEILSGSNVLSASISGSIGDGFATAILDISGKYVPYFFPSQYDTDGLVGQLLPVTASILPQGDLFPIFSDSDDALKKVFITDIVLSKNNPTDIHPFSKIYRPPSGSYAGSDNWNTWYNTLEASADEYDQNNINSLVNNLPEFMRTGKEHKTLRDFVNMLGEQFDLLRSYIDNYENFYTLGYKSPNSIPDNLLPIVGNSLGFDLLNPLSGSLEEYLQSTRGDEVSDKKAISSLWKKIINNLIYVYKTKGTRESINTLLNLYGYDTNTFNLTEFGGSVEEHNPAVVTNNAVNDLDSGLKNIKGNVSFVERTEPFNALNLSSGSHNLALDWYSNDAEPNGIEFIFRTTNTNNTQTLTRASGSNNDLWDLRIIPSGSSNSKGSLQFRLNNSYFASGNIASNAISMSTDFVDDLNNFKFFNVLIQRNVVTSSYEATNALTQSYHMFIGRKDGDKITDIQHVSMSSTSSFANQNFISSSGHTSNNLFFGEIMTGSIAEVRAWDAYISMSKFKQHVLNYRSVVGGKTTTARDNLVYHFPLNENKNSKVIKDISSTRKIKSFDKVVTLQPSLNKIQNSMATIKNFSFRVRGTDAVKSDKQYNIAPSLKVVGNLSNDVKTVSEPVVDGTNTPKIRTINKIGKTYSYVDVIDALIINAMSDFVLDDFLDDGVNDGVYSDLINLRRQLITERNISVDIPKSLDAIESHTDNPGFIQKIEGLLPAKSKLEFSYEVRNDILFRSKIKRADLQTELNPNTVVGSTNLSEPNLSIQINENKFNQSINILNNSLETTALANENLKETEVNILNDKKISSTINDGVLTNDSSPMNIVDLSDSQNQTVQNMIPSNLTNLLLGSKNEFYKNAGKSENQTFFKSSNQGSNNDYNTYKYEDRFFFRTIGDVEGYYPVSGAFEDRFGINAKQPFNHHDNFRHFGNRYYVDSGSQFSYNSFFGSDDAKVNGRMVGRTLFFKSDTDGNITYPINHYFKVGTSKDGLTNLIYKGTQNDGSNPTEFDPELDTSPNISAYTINVGGSDTTKKLKVIR